MGPPRTNGYPRDAIELAMKAWRQKKSPLKGVVDSLERLVAERVEESSEGVVGSPERLVAEKIK